MRQSAGHGFSCWILMVSNNWRKQEWKLVATHALTGLSRVFRTRNS